MSERSDQVSDTLEADEQMIVEEFNKCNLTFLSLSQEQYTFQWWIIHNGRNQPSGEYELHKSKHSEVTNS